MSRGNLNVGGVLFPITQRQARNIRPGSYVKIPGARWTPVVLEVRQGTGLQANLIYLTVQGREHPLVMNWKARKQVAEPPVDEGADVG